MLFPRKALNKLVGDMLQDDNLAVVIDYRTARTDGRGCWYRATWLKGGKVVVRHHFPAREWPDLVSAARLCPFELPHTLTELLEQA